MPPTPIMLSPCSHGSREAHVPVSDSVWLPTSDAFSTGQQRPLTMFAKILFCDSASSLMPFVNCRQNEKAERHYIIARLEHAYNSRVLRMLPTSFSWLTLSDSKSRPLSFSRSKDSTSPRSCGAGHCLMHARPCALQHGPEAHLAAWSPPCSHATWSPVSQLVSQAVAGALPLALHCPDLLCSGWAFWALLFKLFVPMRLVLLPGPRSGHRQAQRPQARCSVTLQGCEADYTVGVRSGLGSSQLSGHRSCQSTGMLKGWCT